MNQEQNDTANVDQHGVTPILPKPPIELGPEEIPAPTYRDTTIPTEKVQEQIPSDMKAANRTSQVFLFIGMGILAVILYALVAFFF